VRFAAARLLVAVSLGIIVLAVLNWLLGGQVFWRSTLFYAMVGSVAVLLANRLVVGGILGTSAFRRRVLVLGAGRAPNACANWPSAPKAAL
jgi:FlaA1/EpsC-like NDP-sugar epimerase